jgi:hypothetical protein
MVRVLLVRHPYHTLVLIFKTSHNNQVVYLAEADAIEVDEVDVAGTNGRAAVDHSEAVAGNHVDSLIPVDEEAAEEQLEAAFLSPDPVAPAEGDLRHPLM